MIALHVILCVYEKRNKINGDDGDVKCVMGGLFSTRSSAIQFIYPNRTKSRTPSK